MEQSQSNMMFHSISKDKNVKTASSLALFLVALCLNACGEEKVNKRHQTQIEKPSETAVPKQAEASVEAEKKIEVIQPVEAEKKAEEPKVEVPTLEPAQPEVPAVVVPEKPEAPVVEPSPEAPVACTMDVVEYCVQMGKAQFERVQFGRSAPDCKFPEAPANTVDAAHCEKDSDSKSL